MSIENDRDFREAFWKWFDSLPIFEKKRFWYYHIDMATTYFYNKIYSRV